MTRSGKELEENHSEEREQLVVRLQWKTGSKSLHHFTDEEIELWT